MPGTYKRKFQMAPKKIVTNEVVSSNDASCLNKTTEDLRLQLSSITEKYEKQQDLILHLTRSVEIHSLNGNFARPQNHN